MKVYLTYLKLNSKFKLINKKGGFIVIGNYGVAESKNVPVQ